MPEPGEAGDACRLCVFTRLPRPGTTKTRLIPALGAAGAAGLQRRLTECTVATARRAVHRVPCRLTVWHSDGDVAAMRAWLGADLDYARQDEGDLGERMRAAFAAALAAEDRRAVIIGSDCPELSVAHLQGAFAALRRAPVVLGPSRDGGYYLLGMRGPHDFLLTDMPWGGERVLAETRRRLRARGVKAIELTELDDIDTPADLSAWRARAGGS